MTATLSKSEIIKAVEALPENVALEDVIERLILLHKVRLGLQQEGEGIPHDKVEAEFRKPRDERQW